MKLYVTAGTEYEVFVTDNGFCGGGGGGSSTIEYKLVVGTTGDPGLTLESSFAPRYTWADVQIHGNALLLP